VAGENDEQRRLAGTVRADDGDELALLDGEADAIKRLLLQRRALAENDLDIGNGNHQAAPPRRRRGRTSATVTSSAVTKLRSEACRPSTSEDSASWMAMR